jgi:hypothetical protein
MESRHPANVTRRRLRRFFIKLVLLAFGLLLGLVIAEISLRMMVPKSCIDLFRYTTETERYKTMKPNVDGVVYGVPLKTNELGFRDVPPALKQPGEYRIVVLGDSFTVCAGVPFDALATTRLESLLRQKSRMPSVRVLNLATAGYGVIEYALLLEEVALGLQPDCVIVANYVPNDYQTKTWLNNREIARGRQSVLREGWFESLYLNRALGPTVGSYWARVTAKFTPARKESAPSKPAFGEGSEGWSENTGAMLRIAKLTKEKGIALHVFLLPHPSNFQKQAAQHEVVGKFCSEHSIAVTDVLPKLVATGKSPLSFRVNIIDSHPNAAYNEIVANVMLDAMTVKSFPPAP